MLATLIQHASPLTESNTARHILAVLPKLDKLPDELSDNPGIFGKSVLEAVLMRRKMQFGEISKTPVAGNLESGALCAWVMVDSGKSVFDQQTVMRKAVQLLLDESPAEIHLSVYGNGGEKQALVHLAIYAAWIN